MIMLIFPTLLGMAVDDVAMLMTKFPGYALLVLVVVKMIMMMYMLIMMASMVVLMVMMLIYVLMIMVLTFPTWRDSLSMMLLDIDEDTGTSKWAYFR